MPSAQVTRSCSGPGFSLTRSVSIPFEHNNSFEIALPAGKTVTSWVKTDADTAACNLPAGHGYTNGKFDVYWAESGVDKARYDVDGTISTNALSLDGGTGDDFPASSHVGVICTKQVEVDDILIAFANVEVLALVLETTLSTARARTAFQEDDATEVESFVVEVEPDADGIAKPKTNHIYAIADGDTNPLGANVEIIVASNGNTTAATLKILVGETI